MYLSGDYNAKQFLVVALCLAWLGLPQPLCFDWGSGACVVESDLSALLRYPAALSWVVGFSHYRGKEKKSRAEEVWTAIFASKDFFFFKEWGTPVKLIRDVSSDERGFPQNNCKNSCTWKAKRSAYSYNIGSPTRWNLKKKDAVKSAELQPCSVPLIRIRVGGLLFCLFVFCLFYPGGLFYLLN